MDYVYVSPSLSCYDLTYGRRDESRGPPQEAFRRRSPGEECSYFHRLLPFRFPESNPRRRYDSSLEERFTESLRIKSENDYVSPRWPLELNQPVDCSLEHHRRSLEASRRSPLLHLSPRYSTVQRRSSPRNGYYSNPQYNPTFSTYPNRMSIQSHYEGDFKGPQLTRFTAPASYDRERRPRGGGGGRNRSRSPPMIDRYQPDRSADRPEFFRQRDDVDRRRRSSPQPPTHIDRYVPGQDPPAPLPTNPLPNPLTLDYQVGFTWFAEWWRSDAFIKEEKERIKTGRRPDRLKGERESREERAKEREQIQIAYDTYKEKLQVQMARSFVLQHKGEEWFKERYNSELREKFRRELADFRQGSYSKWTQDMDAGVFDEFTLEGIYKSESNGAGGIIEKEEGETTAANEVLGVADLLPTRGGDLRDEAALQPTLLIKTIAPTVSREKMEAFCKEHLGEEEGGFRWLSLSDPNPIKKYHRIGWVMLNPSAEKMDIDDRGDGRDEDAEEGEEVTTRSEPDGPAVTVSVAKKALEELNGKTIHDEERGDFTCHVGIHEPPAAPRKKALWDLFSAPERIDRDLELAVRLANKLDAELGEGVNGVALVDERVEELRGKGWLQPPVNAPQPSNKVQDEEMEDDEEGAIDEDEEGAVDDEVDDEELLAKKKRLDLLVEYLRRVYNFCLFCVFESDSVHELTRKCPGGHLRRPRSSLTTSAKTAARASASSQPFPFKKAEQGATEGDPTGSPVDEKKFIKAGTKTYQQLQKAFNWVRTYEDKLLQILDPDSVDLKKIGGKPTEEGVEEELGKYVKQEDEAKYRCKVPDCTKLFKGQVFWKKHVEKRHEDFYEKLKNEVSASACSRLAARLTLVRLFSSTVTCLTLRTLLPRVVMPTATGISR
jgi:hypothetical protein